MKILLVEPDFPIPIKSKNHSNFLPIGLLKIAAYHRERGEDVVLHRGNYPAMFEPDEIKITTLFTYWSIHVWESISYYKSIYPKARVQVGGIFASLMPEYVQQLGCDEVVEGLYLDGEAENLDPAYDLVDVDYQIIHASRGCFRKCSFCGTWKIERNIEFKKSIQSEIRKNKLVFYDNNLLANPYIKQILKEIRDFKLPNNRKVTCESQSGLDGRILLKDPEVAILLKDARFKNPRIAWDGSYKQAPKIYEQLKVLSKAGYSSSELYIFMLFNHDLTFTEMSKKLDACRQWGVRVIDCRYRPLQRIDDGYNSHKKTQTSDEYYIHPLWSDEEVRAFRKAVRRQNIAIMLRLPENRYIEGVERKYVKIQPSLEEENVEIRRNTSPLFSLQRLQ